MSRLRRDPYWFDRILEDITATLDPEYPYHLAGARVVVTGTDVAVYVTIPDTVVRFNARQRRPAHYDRTTTVINVVEALAVDDLDQLSPDPPGDIDRELAELDLPPIAGWRVHPEWPQEMIDDAIGKTCRWSPASSTTSMSRPMDSSTAVTETPSTAPPTTCSTTRCKRPLRSSASTMDGCWCQPGSCSAPDFSDFPKRVAHARPGPWQALTVEGIDLCIATTEPTWVVERTG